MIHSLPTLFKRDSNGNVREWTVQYMAPINPGIRTVSGIVNGKLVESGWNKSTAKNVGRSNATTDQEQAMAEAKAKWDIKLEAEYFENVSQIDSYDKFKPQLARDYTKLPQDHGYSQPKLDGIRCIARKDGLYTRAGKAITTCNHIHETLKPVFDQYPEIILDGELYNHELKADFNKITSLVRKVKPSSLEKEECYKLVQYHIYDCIDATFPDWSLMHRLQFIDIHIENSKCIQKVPTAFCKNQNKLDAKYAEYTEDGYEGQMVRNDAPYENKRSKNLLKRKEFITEEFNVVEVMEGQGNWAGYAKHFRLELGDGREFKSGVRGNYATLKELLEQEEKPTWVTCRYFEKTPDGIPRFPVVIDWGTGERTD